MQTVQVPLLEYIYGALRNFLLSPQGATRMAAILTSGLWLPQSSGNDCVSGLQHRSVVQLPFDGRFACKFFPRRRVGNVHPLLTSGLASSSFCLPASPVASSRPLPAVGLICKLLRQQRHLHRHCRALCHCHWVATEVPKGSY